MSFGSAGMGRGAGTATHTPLRNESRDWIRRWIGGLVVFAIGPLLLILLIMLNVSQGHADIGFATVIQSLISPVGDNTDNIIRYVRLPRAAVGVVSGAALAMAGVLLQSVTRNPLASSTTLGITAGAYFALVVSTVFAPSLLGLSPLAITFAGGTVAALLAYVIAGSIQTTPVRLALAGVAVSLIFSALTGLLQLLYENEVAGLFFWGAGSLMQNDWTGTQYAWPRLLLGAVVAFAIARPLDILSLGDDVARALGQRIRFTRSVGLLTGVFLAAVAVSVVGPVGFIGLVVPHLVRLMGIQQHRWLLLGSAIWGAIVLLGADVVAREVMTSVSELPAGGVTALIGAPFVVWLARRSGQATGAATPPRDRVVRGTSLRRLSYPALLSLATGLLALAIIAGIVVGDVSFDLPTILRTLRGDSTGLAERVILELRLPRLLVAALVGAALAMSGALLQGVVRNPLAGPEIVGVTGGAGLAALVVLILIPGAPFALVPVAAFVGAFATFALVYAASWRDGVTPTRLALVGIAVSAFCAAAINLLVVKAQLRVAQALVWLSGSTYARDWDDLTRLLPWLLVLGPLALLAARQIDLLALGDGTARGLGLGVERARLAILAIAVALAAAAVSTAGTIGFVGLIGPHAARLLLGSHSTNRKLIPVAAVLGALIVTLADTIGRVVLAPKEIPSGLVTALIGAPYFLWLLWRSRTTL